MKTQFKYEFIIDGVVIDRIITDTRKELLACLKPLARIEDRLIKSKEKSQNQ